METRVYSWGDGRPWHSYAAYCRRHFGGRVRKIAVDAGLSCPNRDGTIGSEGCTFCDNRAFTPSYCSPRKSLARQIDEGIAFHAARGRDEGLCLAYFQPFSNTHAPVTRLRELYAEALDHPRISGLVIGTRPEGGTKGFVWPISSLFPIRTLLSRDFGSFMPKRWIIPGFRDW